MKDYSKIPEELKNMNQWVCAWDNSKIPMKAFEKKAASSTAPDTWSSFEQAEWAVENGYYDNLGFVFADNGLVGIDIDAGFEDGLMTPLCADIMTACKSYTEKSRSGRGVHILLRGTLPFHGKNNLAGVEIYKARRFFIMTGKQLIFPTIIENQEAIDYVVEKYFKEVEKENGGKSALVQKIYAPKFNKPEGGKIPVRPDYPPIASGGRNLSLTSLAGAMHNTGYTPAQIYAELKFVNMTQCKPPLDDRERPIPVEMHTSYMTDETSFPFYDCYRVVYHANTLEQLSHIRRTGNEIVRAVFVVTAEYTIKDIMDIALFVKNSPDIDELSFRQLVDDNYEEKHHLEEYLRMGHKKLWWYIEQNDYNLYYAENQVSTRYRDFEKEVQV